MKESRSDLSLTKIRRVRLLVWLLYLLWILIDLQPKFQRFFIINLLFPLFMIAILLQIPRPYRAPSFKLDNHLPPVWLKDKRHDSFFTILMYLIPLICFGGLILYQRFT